MIPALLIWLTRRYGKRIGTYVADLHHRRWFAALLLLLFLLGFVLAQSQTRRCQYRIVRNNNDIGKVNVTYEDDGNTCHIKVTSDIRFRVLFRCSAYVVEEALLRNNTLQYSSIYRKWNGDEKANRQTETSGPYYRVANFGKTANVPYYPVHFHVLQLYIKEPLNVQEVYSENHQQLFKLKKTGDNTYKLLLPGGEYNQYYYENGICTRVELSHSFFTADMLLEK